MEGVLSFSLWTPYITIYRHVNIHPGISKQAQGLLLYVGSDRSRTVLSNT